MNARLTTRLLSAIIAGVLLASAGVAQEIQVQYVPGANDPAGNWTDGTNWDNPEIDPPNTEFPPEGQFREIAVINSNGTVFVNSTIANGPGEIFVPNGVFEVQSNGNIATFSGFTDADLNNQPDTEGNITIGSGGTLRMLGGAQLAANRLEFTGAAAVFDVELTPASNAISVTAAASVPAGNGSEGNATLNGILNIDYTGITNPSGSFALIDAVSATGNFTQINSTGLGQAQVTTISNTNGLIEANVTNLPTLRVNRSGQISVENTHGSGIELDGFRISSAAGSLNGASASPLDTGWTLSSANGENLVAQLFEGPNPGSPTDTLGAMSLTSLGSSVYDRAEPAFFQQDVEDIQFFYTVPGAEEIEGVVIYEGPESPIDNDIVLFINGSGEAAIQNVSAFTQEIEAYRISSSDNSLLEGSWQSLASSGTDGGIWSESAASDAGELLEVTEGEPGGNLSTTFDGTTFNIGTIFNTSGSQAGITFEFLLAGGDAFTAGSVVFDDLPVVGDYNLDGVVDVGDYTVWRDNLGGDGALLPNRDPANGGAISIDDYNTWVAAFGTGAGSGSGSITTGGQVPEPGSWLMLGLAAMCVVGLRRRMAE